MKITKSDVQERFSISVPYAWIENHITTPNLIRMGENAGVYGWNYTLYLFSFHGLNYHVVTGYRTCKCDKNYYSNELKPYTEKLEQIKSEYISKLIDFDTMIEWQNQILLNLFNKAIDEK